MNAKAWRRKVEQVVRNPKAHGIVECTLCGRESIHVVGIIAPKHGSKLSEFLLQPQNKTRTLFYGLCQECMESGTQREVVDRVEEEIIKDIQGGGAFFKLKPEDDPDDY